MLASRQALETRDEVLVVTRYHNRALTEVRPSQCERVPDGRNRRVALMVLDPSGEIAGMSRTGVSTLRMLGTTDISQHHR